MQLEYEAALTKMGLFLRASHETTAVSSPVRPVVDEGLSVNWTLALRNRHSGQEL